MAISQLDRLEAIRVRLVPTALNFTYAGAVPCYPSSLVLKTAFPLFFGECSRHSADPNV